MEFAEGGDLFDKIEPDVGIGEDVAHLYFTQLISGIGFIHSKGVAHRDIKPENIMVDADGNLKIGDFGLSALFRNPTDGSIRYCSSSCGSPPYIAPEVIGKKYAANKADVWSCGVVLFVLCCGITPWAAPIPDDPDFHTYVREKGRVNDEIWAKVPLGALSLLRSMLKLDPNERYGVDEVRNHPWFMRHNSLLGKDGSCSNPLELAAQLLGKLHIDLVYEPKPNDVSSKQFWSIVQIC
jgi:serine/threonine-protein kinase Chk1